MATAVSHLTIEEFHRLYDGVKPNHEYWFGEVIAKPMATSLRGVLQYVLMFLLRGRGWKVASEVTLKLVPEAQPVPDIVASRERMEQPYPTKPVDICVEILSPEDRLGKTIRKANYYLEWGVPCVWIVDPEARTAWVVTPQHPEAEWIHPDGQLTAGPDTRISLTEIFEEVDRNL